MPDIEVKEINIEKEKKFLGMKDKVLPYPESKNTGQPIRDAIYNFIVKRYRKNNHPWMKSDENVWGGTLYFLADWIFIVAWIWLFYLVINNSLKNYGFEKTIFVAIVFILIRINAMVKQLVQLNKNLKGKV